MDNIENILISLAIGLVVATFLLNTGRCLKAIGICKECLKQCVKLFIGRIYQGLFIASYHTGDYTNATKYGRELLVIFRESGEEAKEGRVTLILANICKRQCKHVEAKELYERAISIMIETGDRNGEATAYGQCGSVFQSLGEYAKAQEYIEKALAINMQIGDRKAEAVNYGNLGSVFKFLGANAKAQEYIEKALAIRMVIGDRKGEAADYGSLGMVFISFGEYAKAQEYIEKALAIRMEIGDRKGEAADYGNLGTVFISLGEYAKAQEYIEKALAIDMEIGEKNGEATHYGNLGTVFQSVGKYAKAQEYIEKALAIKVETGNRKGEAAGYGNLGAMFQFLGEYAKAQEYIEKALVIRMEIGDREGEATDYGNLGTVFHSLGNYAEAQEYHEKALAIRMEIGDRKGEAVDYGNLGTVFTSLGDYTKAQAYIEKALAISMEIGNRDGQAADYKNLATVLLSLGKCVQAKEYLKKALLICEGNGDRKKECECLYNLFHVELSQGKVQEALNYLHRSISKTEELRVFLEDNDQFKISFSDVHLFSYQKLSDFFRASGKPNDALCVEEMGRARALADLMAAQYSLEHKKIPAYPHLWIENIMKKEKKCICLYITYHDEHLLIWILKAIGDIYLRKIYVNKAIFGAAVVSSMDDFFAKSFRSFGVLPAENCEDRSLNAIEPELESSQEESTAALRRAEDDEQERQNPEYKLSLCYRMVIGPVVDLLEEPEIIIFPDRSLNRVPFSALTDKEGKYFSEDFRIRLIPSLSILKLIQDSPADFHSQTGTMVVGDPQVGRVRYKGRPKNFKPLPCARKEAEMVGRLLGVQPLLGECATKRAVLEVISSVSLIHIAAHGNAERGEIALAPTVRVATRVPKDIDYLLTMSDISKVQLRAKLVVLSCCHSGRGKIRAEGVVGIARAFLGSGARSVLVALWALEDSATEQLMSRFYEHLAHGESASESLHEAMKWMRENGFPKVADWAPFVLIGDNVTFDFGIESKWF